MLCSPHIRVRPVGACVRLPVILSQQKPSSLAVCLTGGFRICVDARYDRWRRDPGRPCGRGFSPTSTCRPWVRHHVRAPRHTAHGDAPGSRTTSIISVARVALAVPVVSASHASATTTA